MGVLVALGWWARPLLLPERKSWDVLALAVLIVAGVTIYGALTWILKIEDREEFAALFAKVRAKFG